MDIRIDTEFKNLIPELKQTEYDELDASILEEGCRDPLVLWDNVIVDGHNRFAICNKYNMPYNTVQRYFDSREDAKIWIITNQLARRNISPYERTKLVLRLEEYYRKKGKEQQGNRTDLLQNSAKSEPVDTRKELAKIAGVSHDTIQRVKVIEAEATPGQKDKLKAGTTTVNKEYNKIKKNKDKKKQEEQFADIKIIKTDNIYFSRFQDVHFEAESIDHIITDPPYGAEYLPEWEYLAKEAARILKPSGFCICYSGTFNLCKVYKILSDHLEYYWQCVIIHIQGNQHIFPRNIRTGYKPILIFQKPPIKKQETSVFDVIQGSGKEKDLHDWSQPIDEAETLIKLFTEPGDRVLDPFAGAGTIHLACLHTKREPISIECKEINIKKIQERINGIK